MQVVLGNVASARMTKAIIIEASRWCDALRVVPDRKKEAAEKHKSTLGKLIDEN